MIRHALAACALAATPLSAETAAPLTLLDGAAPGFAASASLTEGVLQGRAPCNRYTARLTGPETGFAVDAILSTKMACSEMAAEQRFFDVLSQMTQAEQTDAGLRLTGGGHELVFSSLP